MASLTRFNGTAMRDPAPDIDIEYLLRLLKQKDSELQTLIEKVDGLQRTVSQEMEVNDNLTDLNIHLKTQLDVARDKAKVIVHPSTIKKLTDAVIKYDKRVEELRQALMHAVELIPPSRGNQLYLDNLRRVAQSHA